MPRTPKKSKYKHVVIKNKKYYFYSITWVDITGDSGHADLHTASGFMPAEMITHAYLLNKDKKNVRTFASYEVNDELFSDRNVFPQGCIVKMVFCCWVYYRSNIIMKKKIPAGKKGAGLRALKSKAPEVAKRMGYKKGGLYANIHAKRKRIAAGSGESMRKPGSKGAPTAKQFRRAAKTAKK